MHPNLRNSLTNVCNLLNKHHVEYMVVGGTAVALYGYFRMSISISGKISEIPDLDFWYNPTYKNYFNLLNVIESLGQDITDFKNEKTPNPRKSFFKLNFENFTIDFLPELPGLPRFKKCYERRELTTVDDVDIYFIGFDDLIENKLAIAREKDMNDINELRRIRNNEA